MTNLPRNYGPMSPIKRASFRHVSEWLLPIHAKYAQPKQPVNLIEALCGNGCGILREMIQVGDTLNRPIRAFGIESLAAEVAIARSEYQYRPDVMIYEGDYRDLLLSWLRAGKFDQWSRGLLVYDPFGPSLFDWALTAQVAAEWERIDQAFWLSGRVMNLCLKTFNDPHYAVLSDLTRIGKPHVFVRRLERWDNQKYTMILGTRLDSGGWPDKGFYRVDSKRGREILDDLRYSKDDRAAALQPGLFSEAN